MFVRVKKNAKPDLNDALDTPLLPGEVLIRVTEEFLRKLMTRTDAGERMTVTMNKPNPDGTYAPSIMVEQDGKVVVDGSVLHEWRAFKDAQSKKKGLVVVKGGRIEPVQ